MNTMPKNNFFNYTNEHTDFLYYLLSFAMEQYQNEDPALSDCAKALIRYILGMKETESIVSVRFDTDAVPGYEHYMTAVVINCDQLILIGGYALDFAQENLEGNSGNWYFVHYDPFAHVTMVQSENGNVLYLSMKKLREICGKYPSKNPIFLHYMQFLDEQVGRIEATLQKPINQWDVDDHRRFCSHLMEDSVIDMTRSVVGEQIYLADYYPNPKYSYSLYWYYIPDDQLERMGLWDHVRAIHLYTRLNTINIRYVSNEDNDPYVRTLRNFVRGIHQMPIFFDMSNYKEAIQLAQSILDRLAEEFRL